MIYDPIKNYLFVHIQKTGGTSISDYLVRHTDGQFISPAHLRLRNIHFIHKKPFVFAVVRNPWERLVSWYEMMIRKGVHNDFSRYLLQPGISELPSFSEFIRRTAIVTEGALPESEWNGSLQLAQRDPMRYEKSLSFNQIDYLDDEGGHPAFDRVLHFENLETEFLALISELQLTTGPAKLAQLNSSNYASDWRSYYHHADDRDWVARLYAKDVTFFGFGFYG